MQKRQAFDRWKHQGNMVWSISELAKAFGTGRRNLLMRVEHSGGAFDDTDTYVLPRGYNRYGDSGIRRGTGGLYSTAGGACSPLRASQSFKSIAESAVCFYRMIRQSSVLSKSFRYLIHTKHAPRYSRCAVILPAWHFRRNLIQNPAARAEADQQIIALARTICAMATAPDAAAFAEVVQIGRDITDV